MERLAAFPAAHLIATDTFNRGKGSPTCLRRQQDAAVDRRAIHQHGTCAAFARFTAMLDAKYAVRAQHTQECLVWRDLPFCVLSVKLQRNIHEADLPKDVVGG